MRLALALVVGLAGVVNACDPVHGNAVDALGPEVNGVNPGPLHRSGQPCLECHDGTFGNPPRFTVAGTIFENADSLTPAAGAAVTLRSSDGSPAFTKVTNSAGNFYLSAGEYQPVYPMLVTVTYQGTEAKMDSPIGRAGSCATCHTDPAGTTSAGHVYIPDGGVTP